MLVTSAAVVAPLTPPLLIDLAVPPVRVASRANPLVVPISAVTVPLTGIAVWSEASTTGVLAAIAFWPWVFMRPVNVPSANNVATVVSVAAPVGRGSAVALTGCVVVPVVSVRKGCAAVPTSTDPPLLL